MIVTGHRCNGLLLLELERDGQHESIASPSYAGIAFRGNGSKIDREKIYQEVVNRIREQTGFDRVLLYQFLEDAHGVVIAEANCQTKSLCRIAFSCGGHPATRATFV